MANYETPLLVTGGGGHLARLILEELLHRGVVPGEIITTTREPARLKNLSDRGISVRYGDFDHPASLTEAFAGARRVLIVSTTPEAPYVHGKRFRQQRAGIEAAVAAGARHILYTSAPNPEPGTPAFWKQDHYDTEQVLKACGTTWTVLRHWEWPDWHLAHTWLPAIQRGAYVTATGQGRVAHITRIDTARADAGALLSDEVSNRTVDITGPEALGADEILGRLSSHLGRNVRVVHVEPEELGEYLLRTGVDANLVPVFVAYARAVRLGLYDGHSPEVAALAGGRLVRLHEFFDLAVPG